MLRPEQIHRIKELLASREFSQREISRILRVGRNQISAIAHDRRPDYEQRRRRQVKRRSTIARCPGCGTKTYLPCLLCQMREMRKHDVRRVAPLKRDVSPSSIVRLNLRSAELRRLEMLRNDKLRQLDGSASQRHPVTQRLRPVCPIASH